MDRTACTEPQCLYKGALYLYLLPGLEKFLSALLRKKRLYKMAYETLLEVKCELTQSIHFNHATFVCRPIHKATHTFEPQLFLRAANGILQYDCVYGGGKYRGP